MPAILFDVYCTGRLYGEHFSQVFMVHITIGEGLMDFKLSAMIWDIPWVIGGDFSVTRFGGERKNCSGRSRVMLMFSNLIQDILGRPPIVRGKIHVVKGRAQ